MSVRLSRDFWRAQQLEIDPHLGRRSMLYRVKIFASLVALLLFFDDQRMSFRVSILSLAQHLP